MADIQKVFNRIQESKNESKKIKAMYRDALSTSKEYQDVVEELKELKEKKKVIEEGIKLDFKSEFSRLDQIKTDLESDNLLLSDIAINHIMEGKMIEIMDQYQNKYEPLFSVRFKKL